MGKKLLDEYYKAEKLHREKFGESPEFMGMFMPAIEGQFYIDSIYWAIQNNKPVNELRDASPNEQKKDRER